MLENLLLGSLRKPPSHFLSRGSTLFSLSYETPLNITEAKGTNLFVSEWTFIFAPNISIVSHHHEVLLPSFLLQEERWLSYKSEIKWKVIEEVTNLHLHQSINQSINRSIKQSKFSKSLLPVAPFLCMPLPPPSWETFLKVCLTNRPRNQC